MSLITFRDKNSSGEPVGPTWYLQFDALTVEKLTRSAEVTVYPVETGAVLSDHYQPQPRQIALEGVVSDTPSSTWTNLEGLQNAAAPPVMVSRPLELRTRPDQRRLGPAGILRPVVTGPLPSRRLIQGNVERARQFVPQFATTLQVAGSDLPRSGVNRIARFAEMIDGLMSSRTWVNVILETGAEYSNMLITEMRAPRVSGSGGSVAFSIELQEVSLASPVVTKAATQPTEAKHKKTKAKGTGGKRPTTRGTREAARAVGPRSPFATFDSIDDFADAGFRLP